MRHTILSTFERQPLCMGFIDISGYPDYDYLAVPRLDKIE